jgi:hypothetical protein
LYHRLTPEFDTGNDLDRYTSHLFTAPSKGLDILSGSGFIDGLFDIGSLSFHFPSCCSLKLTVRVLLLTVNDVSPDCSEFSVVGRLSPIEYRESVEGILKMKWG